MSEFPTGPPAALKGEQNDEAAGVAQAGSTLPDMAPGGEGERRIISCATWQAAQAWERSRRVSAENKRA